MSEFMPFGKGAAHLGTAVPAKLVPDGATVEPFQVRDLRQGIAPSYQAIKAKFDPGMQRQGNRFALSEHVANQLSVEQEDLLRFEKRVNEVVESRLSAVVEEARAAAHAQGFETGRLEAFESEKANIARKIELMADAIGSISRAKELLASQYEKALLEIAFRLARTVVNHEIHARPESITHTLQDILGRISKEDDVMIHLPSEAFEAIDAIQREIGAVARAGRITFQIDQRLEKGACVVESLSGEISSSIEERFRRLESEILGGAAPTGEPEKKAGGA